MQQLYGGKVFPLTGQPQTGLCQSGGKRGAAATEANPEAAKSEIKIYRRTAGANSKNIIAKSNTI